MTIYPLSLSYDFLSSFTCFDFSIKLTSSLLLSSIALSSNLFCPFILKFGVCFILIWLSFDTLLSLTCCPIWSYLYVYMVSYILIVPISFVTISVNFFVHNLHLLKIDNVVYGPLFAAPLLSISMLEKLCQRKVKMFQQH